MRKLLARWIMVTIDSSNNSLVRQFFLNPKVYAVVASLFYRLAKRSVAMIDELEDDIRSGFEHNLERRERNDQFRPNKCFRIARSHDLDIAAG